MSTSEICYKMATELVRLIRQKEVSVREVMEAHLSQVDRINPVVNAITTYHFFSVYNNCISSVKQTFLRILGG